MPRGVASAAAAAATVAAASAEVRAGGSNASGEAEGVRQGRSCGSATMSGKLSQPLPSAAAGKGDSGLSCSWYREAGRLALPSLRVPAYRVAQNSTQQLESHRQNKQ